MGESDFAGTDIKRLYLVDACKRDYEALVATGKATPDELAQLSARVTKATEQGHWIDVKEELTAGDIKKMNARLVKTMHFGERPELDAEQVGFTKVVQYLLGWSMKDAAGNVIPLSDAAINNLKQDRYAQIANCIEWWDAESEKALTERKNETAGSTKSEETSPSAG